ncbi:hypothetical protein Cni_G03237 [Canna indica]|uniref:RRM domain-containing protein n=1 Tax=Canna indica TaxID=4628 RepID=A0AAQ3JQU0_9LILI|nr:hypothetical protein Cni_G03237 [Canna indica]
MESIPVDAIRAYHSKERQLFSRLVFILGAEPSLAMKVIAFWLWLEENGHRDIIRRITCLDDGALLDVASAGKAFVESLYLSFSSPGHRHQGFREAAVCGINFYLNGVCQKVLADIQRKADRGLLLAEEISLLHLGATANAQERRNIVEDGVGIQRTRVAFTDRSAEKDEARSACQVLDVLPARKCIVKDASSSSRSKLLSSSSSSSSSLKAQCNMPRDERTLFVTFSNGYPFNEEELHEFFMRHYGDVEMVTVQEAADGKPPLFAHVTFYSLDALLRVLDGDVKVKFMANGKHLWARRFIPKKKLIKNDN